MDVINQTDYTFADSKFSCVSAMFYPHIALSYLIVLSGFMAFVTRYFLKSWHSWMGRIYIISMLWNVALSLLIHNTGLPLGVIISFIYVLGGLTLGWIFIGIHKDNLNRGASPKLTITKRLFSWKTMHGIFMFLSWINIAGRVPFSNIVQHFECRTYPYDKKTGLLVPVDNFEYNKLPWADKEWLWAIMLSVGPLLSGFIIATIVILFTNNAKVKLQSSKKNQQSEIPL